jgi:hypothetical protein
MEALLTIMCQSDAEKVKSKGEPAQDQPRPSCFGTYDGDYGNCDHCEFTFPCAVATGRKTGGREVKSWWDRRSKKLIVTVLAVAVPLANRRFNLGLTDAEAIAIVAALMAWVGSRALVEMGAGVEKHTLARRGTNR